jgi:hypothetical protein
MQENTYPKAHLVYDKGENRRKHSGNIDEAQMIYKNGLWVGKCPQNFPMETATRLLQGAIPEFRTTAAENPYRLWNYYDGAIYVARSQDGGHTWHGYPNGHPMKPPPRPVLRELERRARALKEENRMKAWLDRRWKQKS